MDLKGRLTRIGDVPLVSIIAWSGSGKTTLMERVVKKMREDGLVVGIIKHHSHDTPIDVVGKDSWRFSQAGASPVIISSPTQYSTIRQCPEREATLQELAESIAPEVDIILTEGYRQEAASKVEFMRSDYRTDRIVSDDELVALISDHEPERAHAAELGIPVFDLDDVDGIAEFFAGLV